MSLGTLGRLCAAAIIASGFASANVLPTYVGVTGASGLFTYNYSVSVDEFQYVVTGDEFCMANIFGLTGVASAPVGWTAAERPGNNCPIPAGVIVGNGVSSVLYTYTGAPNIPSLTLIGVFSFQDTLAAANGNIAYGATSMIDANNQPTTNQGEIAGPISPIPEPGTVVLLGAGLLALLQRRRAGNLI